MRKLTVLIVLVVSLIALPASSAFADAGTNEATPASCVGIESAAISPLGSSDELPGGRPQLNEFLREVFPGTPIGQIIGQVARIHAGSHEACDEATE